MFGRASCLVFLVVGSLSCSVESKSPNHTPAQSSIAASAQANSESTVLEFATGVRFFNQAVGAAFQGAESSPRNQGGFEVLEELLDLVGVGRVVAIDADSGQFTYRASTRFQGSKVEDILGLAVVFQGTISTGHAEQLILNQGTLAIEVNSEQMSRSFDLSSLVGNEKTWVLNLDDLKTLMSVLEGKKLASESSNLGGKMTFQISQSQSVLVAENIGLGTAELELNLDLLSMSFQIQPPVLQELSGNGRIAGSRLDQPLEFYLNKSTDDPRIEFLLKE